VAFSFAYRLNNSSFVESDSCGICHCVSDSE
jgi:hypothetical protein